jgi:diguanylate cyclase (GGDEF)-like protein
MLRWVETVKSDIYYRTSLRVKILIPVLLITALVIAGLSWFAYGSLRSTMKEIYEQRARNIAAIARKSIQEGEYVLYYSEKLDADVEAFIKRYESVVGVTVLGMSGRGLQVVSSSDPTIVGRLVADVVSDEVQDRLYSLRDVELNVVQLGKQKILRAYVPLIIESELVGAISVDVSLEEQQRFISTLSWQIMVGSLVGFFVLGMLLYTILRMIVTRPIFRLAKAAQSVSQRNYEVQVSPGPSRKPGTVIRDEVANFIEVFNLMVKVIASHEKKLREMVILDELTGVYNLAHFKESVSQEIKKGQRYKHPTSILLVEVRDVENLKKADRDKVLITTGNFMIKEVRTVDPVFRVGETRFAALLPLTPPAGAQVAADRMRARSVDITLPSALPFSLRIAAIGWSQEDAPEVEDVLRQVQAPLGDD